MEGGRAGRTGRERDEGREITLIEGEALAVIVVMRMILVCRAGATLPAPHPP